MQSSWIDKFTRSFFWFGFVVFLSASIPHLAAYYRHFDPNATGWTDTANWTIGYLIAIVIDVTDVLVSIAVLKEINRGTKKRHLLGYWVFIVFVMALSWLVNWQYNIVYQTNAFAKAESIQIFGVLVGSVNPVIGSAFQLLLLVYTAMAHKFAEKPVQKTAEQLRQEADELEQVAMQQARIDAVKKAQNDSKVGGLIDSLEQAKERAKQLFGTSQNNSQSDVNQTSIEEVKSPELETSISESKVDIEDMQNEPQAEYPDDVLSVLVKFPKVQSWLTTSQRTATIEQVVDVTGLSKRRVVNRLKDGTLKRNSRNANLVHITSVIEYLKTDPITNRLTGDTGEMPTLQLVANR